jgi:outer membrane lipoprotein-sorting protein
MQGATKIMKRTKLVLWVGVAILLAGCSKTVVQPPGEVFKKAQDAYASLNSYTDEGKTVAVVNGMTLTTTFTIKLARPNLYRIEWAQVMNSFYTNRGVVWSAGDGDFMMLGNGATQKESNQQTALASATGVSGGAAATIPESFFKTNWGNPLGGAASGAKQQSDEKVGDVDCYVFANELKKGMTRTLWIGKQDLLIRQARTVTSADAIKAVMAETAKSHPEIAARMQQSGIQGITSTETHANIVVNPKLSAADFAH